MWNFETFHNTGNCIKDSLPFYNNKINSTTFQHPECECTHHTCGPNCDRCCPLFNQRQWGPGSSRDARKCLPCNCHGHATSCHYEEAVDRAGLSLDINGDRQGGGVCDNCTVRQLAICILSIQKQIVLLSGLYGGNKLREMHQGLLQTVWCLTRCGNSLSKMRL